MCAFKIGAACEEGDRYTSSAILKVQGHLSMSVISRVSEQSWSPQLNCGFASGLPDPLSTDPTTLKHSPNSSIGACQMDTPSRSISPFQRTSLHTSSAYCAHHSPYDFRYIRIPYTKITIERLDSVDKGILFSPPNAIAHINAREQGDLNAHQDDQLWDLPLTQCQHAKSLLLLKHVFMNQSDSITFNARNGTLVGQSCKVIKPELTYLRFLRLSLLKVVLDISVISQHIC